MQSIGRPNGAFGCGTFYILRADKRTLGEITSMMRDLVDPFSYLAIPSSDPVFPHVDVWLRSAVHNAKHASILNGRRRTEVVRTVTNSERGEAPLIFENGSYKTDPAAQDLIFSADLADIIYIVFEGRTVAASYKHMRSCDEETASSTLKSVFSGNTLTLRILGRDNGPLRRLIEEARRDAEKRADAYTAVYKPESVGRWKVADKVAKYDMANSKHDPKMLADIIQDLERFFNRKALYASKGRRWKRGILLYGPPGSGKSTLIHLLASHFNRSIAHAGPLNSATPQLAKKLPGNAFLVFEDVDCGTGVTRNSADFSAVLNVLDGFSDYQDGMVVIMTTNHVGKIDPALLRPGRMDVKFFVGQPNDEQCKAMYCNFFASTREDMARIDLEQRQFDYSSVPAARYDEAVAFVGALKQESDSGDLTDAFGSPIMSCAFIENVLSRAMEPQYALETLRQCIDEARILSEEQRKDRDHALKEEARNRGLLLKAPAGAVV
nr:AAA ATPase bs.1 [Pandoravirus massiliensis]